MFEHAILRSERKPWSLTASFAVQSIMAGLALLLPVLRIEAISPAVLRPPLPLPQRPASVKLVPGPQTGRRTTATIITTRPTTVFVAPSRIPNAVARIEDDAATWAAAARALQTGDPGSGVYGATALASPPPTTLPVQIPPPAPPAAPDPVQRIRVGGDVMAAMLLTRVVPQYPALAKQARVSGTVKLIGVIARDGTIQQLQVLSGHPLLVPAAVEAVRRWTYRPTLLNGVPVEVTAPIDVHFTLAR